MTSLRPDEQATNAEIERARGRDQSLNKGIKTAAALGTAAIGGGIASKVMPFLSEYIPADLAMKGINKVSPRLGEFLQNGLKKGLNLKDGLEFIKDSFQSKDSVKEDRNIIKQYDDRLNEFLEKNIKKGLTAAQAIDLAQVFPNYKKSMEQIVKDHKVPFQSIVEGLFGSSHQAPANAESHPQQNQEGQGQQALTSILQRIQAAKGGQM